MKKDRLLQNRAPRCAALCAGLAVALSATGCAQIFGVEAGELDPSVDIDTDIVTDTRWGSDTSPHLTTLIVVKEGATLTIDRGTRITSAKEGGLLIEPGARIHAVGTKESPIVFTSDDEQREKGDWRGLFLCGRAPISTSQDGTRVMDSVPSELGIVCGGLDPDDTSGEVQYVRIEFAGRKEGADSAPGGFELNGVGRGTTIDHVQVHASDKDGMVLFGGTVRMKHLLITSFTDDGLDWAYGYRGQVQFAAIVQGTGSEAKAIEGGEDNTDAVAGTEPSAPILSNVTLIGDPQDANGAGIGISDGSRGEMHNFLIASFGDDALDIDDFDPATFTVANGGRLTLMRSIFATENAFSDDDDPAGFLESSWAMDAAKSNTFPGLGADGLRNRVLPGLDVSLGDGAEALSGGVVPADDGFFDPSVTFIGACGSACPDFEGWTDFPVE